jgi:hypothetical protein
MKTKGKFFDPVVRDKLKKEQVFETRKYNDRIEYIFLYIKIKTPFIKEFY